MKNKIEKAKNHQDYLRLLKEEKEDIEIAELKSLASRAVLSQVRNHAIKMLVYKYGFDFDLRIGRDDLFNR